MYLSGFLNKNIRPHQYGTTEIKLTCLGEKARLVLSSAQAARIIGFTSRGIFLHTSDEHVLFLSWEDYRGPLTLNLAMRLPGTVEMEVGDPVSIQECTLWFQKQNLLISFNDTETWEAPRLQRKILAPRERFAYIERVKKYYPNDTLPFAISELQNLSESINARDPEAIVHVITGFLGRGVGLTPQGDDLVIGLLLTLNRWRPLFPDFCIDVINQQIIRAAHRRTTGLSAGLITCSVEGQADQRLICGLDGLVTGTPDSETCAALFQGWGSTSGGASFHGMAVALNTAAK